MNNNFSNITSSLEETNQNNTHSLLDAYRGNQNWIASTPRDAFFTFGDFAVEESRKQWNDSDLAGMPKKKGIHRNFMGYVKNHKAHLVLNFLIALLIMG